MMKKIKTLGLIFLFLCEINFSEAQEFLPEKPLKPENVGFYTGGHASTNGLGINFGYILNKRFTFRTGYETMNLKHNFDFEENDVSYNADLQYKTGGIFLFADYYYTSRLYITLGGIINNFQPDVSGYASSDMKYGDIYIPAEDVGTFNFKVEPELKYSPYAGAGIRNFLGKNEKLVYSFETGFYYMGAPKFAIATTGLLAPTSDPAHKQKEFLEKQFDAYKIYPILKFNLAFKIF